MAVRNTQSIRRFDKNTQELTQGGTKMEGSIMEAGRYIGAGMAMLGAAGAGIGVGLSALGALTGMARNPDTYGNLLSSMILGIAFSEAIAIYCLVISFLMLFKVV
jgi:F-type H+-transporting ATPase subunit c